jgi:predicted metalloprotease with PDZ domain
MPQNLLTRSLRFSLLAVLATLFVAPTAAQPAPVQYELRFDEPSSHLLRITVRATGLRGPFADFAMPAWAPGWYVINDYAKMVQEFRATDAQGRALPFRKTDKQTWRVELGGSDTAAIEYKLFGNFLSVDWVQYNDRHAHIAGPAAWMYLVGGKERPVRLIVEPPAPWRIATGLALAGANTFTAPDYDSFIDAPIEISDFAEQTFTTGGATYHIVVHDVLGKKDFTQFTRDTRKIVETEVAMMSPVAGGPGRAAPFEHYYFLFHIWPNTGGGLEHLNSTDIFLPFDWDPPAPGQPPSGGYEGQLGVTAHEFFHAWNVKRMRPRPLGPFDYSREAHTPSLWISEGFTSYYGDLSLLRAGLTSPERYLENMGQGMTGFERQPGRRERSLEEASWDTWFWYVGEGRAPSNRPGTDIDYYGGGEIMGLLLDLAIRNATNNQKSLDDWMRLMYARYALPKPGFEPADAVRAASEVAGRDMSDFFRRFVSGKETPPYEEYLAWAGIRVEKTWDQEHGWLGASIGRAPSGQARLNLLRAGGPAEQAGLDRGDVVVSLDGREVTQSDFNAALAAKKPGDTVALSINRSGEVKQITVTLAANPYPAYRLIRIENPSPAQAKIWAGWITGR